MDFQLAVADTDKEFVTLLSDVLKESGAYRIVVNHEEEDAAAFIEEQRSADVLLVNSRYLGECIPSIPENIVVLCDSPESLLYWEKEQVLFKYQPMDQTARVVHSYAMQNKNRQKMEHSAVENGGRDVSEQIQCKAVENQKNAAAQSTIISVYSAIGGSGKTTVALNAAQQFAEQGRSVLYVSLELDASVTFMSGGIGRCDMSRLNYYLQSRPQQAAYQLERMIESAACGGFHYITPSKHIRELAEMTEDNTMALVDCLQALHQYEIILIDLDSSPSERCKAVLERSNFVCWVLLDDIHGLHKTMKHLHYLKSVQGLSDVMDRTCFFINKFTGRKINGQLLSQISESASELPYIPAWKGLKDSAQLLTEVLYGQELERGLCPLVLSENPVRKEGIR